MSRPGGQTIAPRGFVAVLLVVALAVVLVWAAFWRTTWLPQAPFNATSTPAQAERYELTLADNGRSFTYPITSRFDVMLPANYPRPDCVPAGILGYISNAPAVGPGVEASRYEAVMTGSCTLTSGDWQVVVLVTN
jgi:hypothetical protein